MDHPFNQLDIKFTHKDGRVFEARHGELSKFSYTMNGYSQHGFEVEFRWNSGTHTSMFYPVDKASPDLIGAFMLEVIEAAGNCSSDQIIGQPLYILFTEERRNIPLGLAGLRLPHTSIIFNDFFGWE